MLTRAAHAHLDPLSSLVANATLRACVAVLLHMSILCVDLTMYGITASVVGSTRSR